ncbi:hypothetical protein CTA1_5036, partial [Colletotrichum tanaceti]
QRQEVWPQHASLLGRPGPGLHQKDHGPARPLDAPRQDLQARHRHHRQGHGRARRALAVRRRHLWQGRRRLQVVQVIQVVQIRRRRHRQAGPRKRRRHGSRRRRRRPRKDGTRDPVRDRRHLPPDHRLRHLPAPAQRRLHLQRARLRRRRLGRARRVGRQRRQGDRQRRARPAARLQHQQPPRRHPRQLPPRRMRTGPDWGRSPHGKQHETKRICTMRMGRRCRQGMDSQGVDILRVVILGHRVSPNQGDTRDTRKGTWQVGKSPKRANQEDGWRRGVWALWFS